MNTDDLPVFEKNGMLPPIKITPQQEDLCKRLDSLNQRTVQDLEMSKILRGAIYATRDECRSNPDWMAQSAHSFREILYPFFDRRKRRLKINVNDAFKLYGSVTIEEEIFRSSLYTVYGKLTDVAHHLNTDIKEEEYERLIEEFQNVLHQALYRQIDIHDQIDEFLSKTKPSEVSK